jgi:hypothetical protein
MSEGTYSHPRIPEVLAAYELLLNDSMALDYCGITGKDRKLILNDGNFSREIRKIKAGKYIEEIKDINDLIKSLGRTNTDDNTRLGGEDDDPTKLISLKMKVTSMRREMLSLSSSDKETDESESLNIFFIDVSREEFEKMLNVEIHDGDAFAKLTDEDKEAPIDALIRRNKEEKKKTSIPAELSRNTIEYVGDDGERIIEEVQE